MRTIALLLLNLIDIYNWILIFCILATYFDPQHQNKISYYLGRISDPYLNLFNHLIPPIAGVLQLNGILAFLVLFLLKAFIIKIIL
jgi:YggT family protein